MQTTTTAVAAMPLALCSRPSALQPDGQRRGEHRFAEDAAQQADGGDADLDGGQEARRLLAELHGRCRERVPALGERREPRLARGEQRHLGHGEKRR